MPTPKKLRSSARRYSVIRQMLADRDFDVADPGGADVFARAIIASTPEQRSSFLAEYEREKTAFRLGKERGEEEPFVYQAAIWTLERYANPSHPQYIPAAAEALKLLLKPTRRNPSRTSRRTSRRTPARTSRSMRSNARPIQIDASVVDDAMKFASKYIDRFLTNAEHDRSLGLIWRTEVLWAQAGKQISPIKQLLIKDVRGRKKKIFLRLRIAKLGQEAVEGRLFSKEDVYQELKSQAPYKDITKFWQDLRDLLDEMLRRDVAGIIEVYVHPNPVTVDGVDMYNWEYLRSFGYLNRLQDVLEHELTHAMEIHQDRAIASVPSIDTWLQHRTDILQHIDDPTISPSERLELRRSLQKEIKIQTEYWNRYWELRAYMRNIVSEILPIIRLKMLDHKYGSSRQESFERDLSHALNQSKTWNAIDPALGQKSRNILLKGIVTALEDEGIITIE